MLSRRFAVLFLAALLGAACSDDPSVPAAPPSLAGEWSLDNPPEHFGWGDSIRFSLTQQDSVVTGTYTVVRGTHFWSGQAATYSGPVAGRVRPTGISIGLAYDAYAQGCTGASRSCQQHYLVVTGTRSETGEIPGTADFEGGRQWPVVLRRQP